MKHLECNKILRQIAFYCCTFSGSQQGKWFRHIRRPRLHPGHWTEMFTGFLASIFVQVGSIFSLLKYSFQIQS